MQPRMGGGEDASSAAEAVDESQIRRAQARRCTFHCREFKALIRPRRRPRQGVPHGN